MRPAQFATQCVTNLIFRRILTVKLAEVAQIHLAEDEPALAEFTGVVESCKEESA